MAFLTRRLYLASLRRFTLLGVSFFSEVSSNTRASNFVGERSRVFQWCENSKTYFAFGVSTAVQAISKLHPQQYINYLLHNNSGASKRTFPKIPCSAYFGIENSSSR